MGAGLEANPLDLDYARPSPRVFLIQLGINQKVDEARIFAAGHGVDAAIIAAAGMVLCNVIVTLLLSRIAYRSPIRADRPGWALLAFWCTAASIGNMLDHVPIRTFTLDGDMGSVQRGLGCSPWAIIVLIGLPTVVALSWFFRDVVPKTLARAFPGSLARRRLFAAVAAAAIFGVYGMAGFLESDAIGRWLSALSVFVILPVTVILLVLRVKNSPQTSPARLD